MAESAVHSMEGLTLETLEDLFYATNKSSVNIQSFADFAVDLDALIEDAFLSPLLVQGFCQAYFYSHLQLLAIVEKRLQEMRQCFSMTPHDGAVTYLTLVDTGLEAHIWNDRPDILTFRRLLLLHLSSFLHKEVRVVRINTQNVEQLQSFRALLGTPRFFLCARTAEPSRLMAYVAAFSDLTVLYFASGVVSPGIYESSQLNLSKSARNLTFTTLLDRVHLLFQSYVARTATSSTTTQSSSNLAAVPSLWTCVTSVLNSPSFCLLPESNRLTKAFKFARFFVREIKFTDLRVFCMLAFNRKLQTASPTALECLQSSMMQLYAQLATYLAAVHPATYTSTPWEVLDPWDPSALLFYLSLLSTESPPFQTLCDKIVHYTLGDPVDELHHHLSDWSLAVLHDSVGIAQGKSHFDPHAVPHVFHEYLKIGQGAGAQGPLNRSNSLNSGDSEVTHWHSSRRLDTAFIGGRDERTILSQFSLNTDIDSKYDILLPLSEQVRNLDNTVGTVVTTAADLDKLLHALVLRKMPMTSEEITQRVKNALQTVKPDQALQDVLRIAGVFLSFVVVFCLYSSPILPSRFALSPPPHPHGPPSSSLLSPRPRSHVVFPPSHTAYRHTPPSICTHTHFFFLPPILSTCFNPRFNVFFSGPRKIQTHMGRQPKLHKYEMCC